MFCCNWPCSDEGFPHRQWGRSQNQLLPICGYRYLNVTFIQNVPVYASCGGTLQSSVGSLQCWRCSPMSFVGISTTSFCQHLFFFVYLASFMYQTLNFFCTTRAHRLPLCLHLESCSLTDPTEVPECVSKQRFGTFRLKHFATRRLTLCFFLFFFRRPPHLFTAGTSSTVLCRDQVSKIRRGSPSMDYWHCREGQPHGQNYRQTTNHRSCTTGGHSEREPNAGCHLLM